MPLLLAAPRTLLPSAKEGSTVLVSTLPSMAARATVTAAVVGSGTDSIRVPAGLSSSRKTGAAALPNEAEPAPTRWTTRPPGVNAVLAAAWVTPGSPAATRAIAAVNSSRWGCLILASPPFPPWSAESGPAERGGLTGGDRGNRQTTGVSSAQKEHQDAGGASAAGHPRPHGGAAPALALGALGVVFGDIGTSPLYALQTVFSIDNGAVRAVPADVYGVISLVFWSILLIVSVKYVVFVMRASNDGEGGIMALAALIRRRVTGQGRLVAVALLLGIIGASLFFGDSVITPAISVLSAVEGIDVVSPGVKDAVLPIGAVILIVLFLLQRFGTTRIGRLFGPVMLLWFVTLAVLGIPPIVAHPSVLRGLSPTYAFAFVIDRPFVAFIAMGAVVLSITGAEALYADMGHFGRSPIRSAWFAVVFPALTINYLGQGALILHQPSAVANPFYLLVPGWAQIPMVVLATLATVIASQAVISGAFSVSRQAVRLGLLPHLTVRQTSHEESGQIYVPAVNWLLLGGVLILMFAFRSSQALATAYGLAVTGTLLLTTALFLVLAGAAWHWPVWRLVVFGIIFGGVELTFFAANLTKIVHGGWLPLLLGALVVIVMLTWQRGRRVITARRTALEGELIDFVDHLRERAPTRVPGTAVFPHPSKETVPLALRANLDFNGVVHQHVVIVSVVSENVPHVPRNDRLNVDSLDHSDDGIVFLSVRFGFQDDQNIPAALRDAFMLTSELEFDPDEAFYFLSRITIERGKGGLPNWQKRLFIGLSHNAASPAAYFRLPVERTIVMGTRVEL
ncbi:MAG TPA: KUP/HAK/KT family potassium transporter [Pseudonocardiaceae bacterium]|nr:KUP/HAK/KT family potassium transporter [Pseudonocardiaceae bacterium]